MKLDLHIQVTIIALGVWAGLLLNTAWEDLWKIIEIYIEKKFKKNVE